MSMGSIHVQPQTTRWITPIAITEPLGPFDLDPCADEASPYMHAWSAYTIEDDGLAQKWSGRVWLNPPYGRETKRWLERMAWHRQGTALVFARTDTRMFHHFVFPVATGMLFIAGRPKFFYPSGEQAKGTAGGPLVLIAYGEYDAMRLQADGPAGHYVSLKTERRVDL